LNAVSSADGFWLALGLVQMLVLPGLVMCRAVGVRGLGAWLLGTVVLSLLINHFLVLAMGPLGWMHRPAWLGVIAVECLLLVLIQRRAHAIRPEPESEADSPLSAFIKPTGAWLSDALRSISLVFGAVALAWACWVAWTNIGTVFTAWDAVASWNRWAVEWWARGEPRGVREYPQLIPSVWAISYALLGHDALWHGAKASVGVFPLMLVGAMCWAGWRRGSAVYLLGAGLSAAGLVRLYPNYLASGYVDIPVAAFATAAWAMADMAARTQERGERWRLLLLACAAAGAAGLTKQAGLVMLIVCPLVYLFASGQARRASDAKPTLEPARARTRPVLMSLGAFALIGAMLLPWYLRTILTIAKGKETAITGELVFGMHASSNVFDRLAVGWGAFEKDMGTQWLAPTVLVLSVIGLWHRDARWVVALLGIPFWIIWALAFNYDTRNLALGVPALALGVAGASVAIAGLADHLGARFRGRVIRVPAMIRRAGVVVAAIASVGLIGWLSANPARLANAQIERRFQHGVPSLNTHLREFDARYGFDGKIATHYAILPMLPGYESRAIFISPRHLAHLETMVSRPDVRAFLIRHPYTSSDDPRIIERVRELIDQSELVLCFDVDGWLYAIRHDGSVEIHKAQAVEPEAEIPAEADMETHSPTGAP